MIARVANGIWEITIPAPLPYSDSEKLVGYARYLEGCIEVRSSHMIATTERGRVILPISEDKAVRANLGRALLWSLMSEVLVATTEVGLARSDYIPPMADEGRDVISLAPAHFDDDGDSDL